MDKIFSTCVCIVLDNLLLSDYDIATSSAEFGFEYMCSDKHYLLWGHLCHIATSSAEFGFEYMCSDKHYLLWGHLCLFGVAEMMI